MGKYDYFQTNVYIVDTSMEIIYKIIVGLIVGVPMVIFIISGISVGFMKPDRDFENDFSK